MYGVDEELRRIDTANKENVLYHIKQALGIFKLRSNRYGVSS